MKGLSVNKGTKLVELNDLNTIPVSWCPSTNELNPRWLSTRWFFL